jgi:hypothetical protein
MHESRFIFICRTQHFDAMRPHTKNCPAFEIDERIKVELQPPFASTTAFPPYWKTPTLYLQQAAILRARYRKVAN